MTHGVCLGGNDSWPHRSEKRLIEAALAQVPVSPAESSCMLRSPCLVFVSGRSPDQIGTMTISIVTAKAKDRERHTQGKRRFDLCEIQKGWTPAVLSLWVATSLGVIYQIFTLPSKTVSKLGL